MGIRVIWLSLTTLFILVIFLARTFIWGEYILMKRYFARGESVLPSGHALYSPTEKIEGSHLHFFETANDKQKTVSKKALRAARDYAEKNRSESLLIWHQGALQLAEYWMGTDRETTVNSRSMHKMVGGLLIARAVKDGYINSVDDSIADYIPVWRKTEKEAITIRNILHMSSGLRWFSIRDPGPFGLSARRYLHPFWDEILLNDVPMSFKPGSEYDYSDITADVMPHIIQGATGMRYAKYFSEALLKPLNAEGGEIWINRTGGMPHGGCCLLLPPETWLRFGIFLVNGGKWDGQDLLPANWINEMLTPSQNKEHFGFMIWLGKPYVKRRLYHRPESPINQTDKPGVYNSEPFLSDDLYMFDGAEGRLVYIVPSEQLVIVRTGFRPLKGDSEWDNAYLPNTIIRGIKTGSKGSDQGRGF